ncbi:flagellar hook-length control protein FliK [Cryobacterium sp. M15]|uniref:flagellar hook-length control protein FliK n=1 Tax=Cryobacterium sp. M15 TaxID=2048291 RepID=UPI000CE3AC3A|nr:flagellar hook-length control protein FliK [Cryobacterium sp. M15]
MTLILGHFRPAAAPSAPVAARETRSVSPGADAFGSIMDDALAGRTGASSAPEPTEPPVSTEPPEPTGDHAADSTAGSTSSLSVVHPDFVAADATIPVVPVSFPAAFAWDNTAAVVADGTGHSVTSVSAAHWNALDAAAPVTAAVAALAATAGTFGVTAGSAASIASAAVATIPALRTPDPATRTIAVVLPTGDAGAAAPTATTFASVVVVAAPTAAAQAAAASSRATVTAASAADATPTAFTTAEVTADVTASVTASTTPPPASAISGVVTASRVPATAVGVPATAAGVPATAADVPATAAGGAAQAGAAQAGAVRNTATLNTAVTIAGASGFAVPDSVRLTGRGADAVADTDTDAVAHSASLAPAASALPTAGPIGLPAVVSTPTTAVVAAPASVNAMPLTAQIMKPLFSLTTAAPGEHVLTISVSPDNLGPVTVRAHVTGEGIRVELFAPTDLARDALRVILPDLRRDLAGSGLSAQLNLSSDSQAGDPSATRQPRSEANARNSDARSPDGRAPDTPREQRPPQFGSTHTIDVLA